MPLPGSTRAAVAVKSEAVRLPEGFLAQFPDGGSAQVVQRRANIYLIDTNTRSQKLLGTLVPSRAIRSGFGARMLGWAGNGSECYVEIFGNTGTTSDTPVTRQTFRLQADGPAGWSEISSVPGSMVSATNGEFDTKRRLHIWATDISIQIWAPQSAPTTVLFTLDPASGELMGN